jgi:outer membrane protein TolC
VPILLVLLVAVLASWPAPARAREPLTLDEAIRLAVRESARGRIIRGDVEVKQGLYQASRSNFYFPSVSINGQVPSYSVDQSYKFFGGSTRKRLYKTQGLDLTSFIQLQQSLVTGGTLNLRANLANNRDRYPDTDPAASPNAFLDEVGRRGYFDFALSQPILRPSQPRYDLANRKNDVEQARLTRVAEEAKLSQEVTEAFVGVLLADLRQETARDRLEAAGLQAGIDSTKWTDGVLSEEEWLTSASKRLDGELSLREAAAATAEQRRALALLLDVGDEQGIGLVQPELPPPLPAERVAALRDAWSSCRAVRQAELEQARATRAADFAAAGHGLTGDLKASYSIGRGEVKLAGSPADNINTNGWGVSLDFSFPVWDGGASGAAVRSAHFEAERARLQLARAKQDARAEIGRLLDLLDVSGRRLEILSKQEELAARKERIAEERFADERINRVTMLEAEVARLEARVRVLEELKTYLVNRIDLESRFEDQPEHGGTAGEDK